MSGRRPANSYTSVITSAGRGAMLGMNGYGGVATLGGGIRTSTGSCCTSGSGAWGSAAADGVAGSGAAAVLSATSIGGSEDVVG